MLDEQKAECLGDTHIQKVECLVNDYIYKAECLVNDHKTVECLRYDKKADGYHDQNITAPCFVNDHPLPQWIGNTYLVSDKADDSLVNHYPYAIWWVND